MCECAHTRIIVQCNVPLSITLIVLLVRMPPFLVRATSSISSTTFFPALPRAALMPLNQASNVATSLASRSIALSPLTTEKHASGSYKYARTADASHEFGRVSTIQCMTMCVRVGRLMVVIISSRHFTLCTLQVRACSHLLRLFQHQCETGVARCRR